MFRVKHLLVPCDFSPFSDAAVKRAVELALASKAKLHLLHILGTSPLGGRPEPEDERYRLARERIDQQLSPLAAVELQIEKAIVSGTPHREICRYAQKHDIDLIVMGTRGRTGLAHIALGSVAEKVVAAAPCQVLVVRQRDQDDELVDQAARVLHDEFGESFGGEFGDTRASLKGRLIRLLNISEHAAEFAIEKLRANGALTWEDSAASRTSTEGVTTPHTGTWHIGPFASGDEDTQPDFKTKSAENTPATDLLKRAVAARATDIHIDPVGREYSVRFRIDGLLERYCQLDLDVAAHLIQQFKTMALLDIADPFHAQEGRLHLPSDLPDLEARLTTAPVSGGEALALRLFNRENVFRPLDRLGLSESSLAAIDGMTQRGEGLVLVTGPAGSGKTTTVYSILQNISSGQRNIVSIEDPVEFPAPFVRQMQVDERHGLCMTSGLRTLLRMDPDIVFLGEIRDAEAAEISMRAASSGKYVFSTLHTRDVASTLTALRDLHVDTHSLAGNLTGIISQRLVRRLCPQCCQSGALTASEQATFQAHGFEPPPKVSRAVGCPACRNTGYRGRIGIFEVVLAEEELLQEIARNAPEHELRDYIRRSGTLDLTNDALAKVAAGITTLDEALRMHSV